MNLYNVVFNNTIPFVLIETNEGENVIYCNRFKEHFFNVGEFNTKTKPIILEYVVSGNEKYAYIKVALENGVFFENVKFKIVESDNTDLPYSTINFNTLYSPQQEDVPIQEQYEEETEPEPEAVVEQPKQEPVRDIAKEHENITLEALRSQYPADIDLRGAYFGKIPVVLLIDNNSENTLYCKSFTDYLFNVGLFATKTKEVLLEYSIRGGDKYAVTDIIFENGECYRNVKFKVVVADTIETPFSTVNLSTIGRKEIVPVPEVEPVQESIEANEPEIPTVTDNDKSEILEKKKEYEQAIKSALAREKKLDEEREKIKKQRILLENSSVIEKKLEQYKQDLLEEYFNATQKQSHALDIKLDKSLKEVQRELEEKITNTFTDYSLVFEEEEQKKINKLHSSHQERLVLLLKKIDTEIDKNKQELYSQVEKKFAAKECKIRDVLEEKAKQLEKNLQDKNVIELEKYREKLLGNFEILSQVKIDELLSEKGADILEKVKDVDDKIEKILKEKSNFAIKGKFTSEQEQYITDTARYWARRILDLGGGGGTVAVQYAKGGIIDGPLTVTGALTVNNVNVCGDLLPCTTETYNIGSSALKWKDLYLAGNTIYIGDAKIESFSSTIVFPEEQITKGNSFVSGGNIDVTAGGKYLSAGVDLLDVFAVASSPLVETTFTTVHNFSGGWQQAYEQLASTTSIINYLSGQIDLNVFQNINSSYETIHDFVSNPHANVYSGYTVTLVNRRVYVLAGPDQNNAAHYLELNANPMKPIYVEQTLDNAGVVVDLFNLTDFRSAKYTLQIQTNYDNEIYYSEINVVGAVGTMQSEAVEYGQLYTSQLIDNYSTYIQGGKLYLSATFVRTSTSPSDKYIIKGLRTNFYKI